MGKIIKANQTHAPFIYHVSQQANLSWSLQDYITDMQQPYAVYFIHEAGFIGAHLLYDEAEILNIAILKSYQRQGYAKALWQALECELKQKHYQTCYLEVRASNEPAKQFYETIGFKKISERKRYYKNPIEDAWIYRWENV
ncbi:MULTISPECIES: ribosomal protein S18-alanine N-acetyltransferase [unclassified Granulicatella]|uniref:ribosomal protein S18-alanine N-acetyltransferase n=1 Tax=unclassified Granulicatella TaxID=2630493 RepID=UPI00107488AC|nr:MULTISPECIES: ribosomal protein S18-alanine N-acetyltransferase [unclassified Granulicatella]MBF0779640.1 ribosomal protein S18-alanine N-acetyltransferase [Granulicatella sp. 19428wC4_WM01]TFU96298.1 ribosomal-protein-alanine N-acetyltransferase [Granulicatella sp. WM01]